jgi:DnaD/phage-associated family protein
VDPTFKAICEAYRAAFGYDITPAIAADIEAGLRDGVPQEWYLRALLEAKEHKAKHWNYVDRIISRWKEQGYMTTGPPARDGGERQDRKEVQSGKGRRRYKAPPLDITAEYYAGDD